MVPRTSGFLRQVTFDDGHTDRGLAGRSERPQSMNGAVMKIRFSTSLVAAIVVATFAVTLGAQQAAKAEPPKPTPRTTDGHPDLSGVWDRG
jgi:hypothetical protein